MSRTIGLKMDDTTTIEEFGFQPGAVIAGRYEIVACLGMGGMGAVYLVKDAVLADRQVALKILHSDLVRDESIKQRFLREVQLMNTINHPNVARTYDVGRDQDMLFFTMEYLVGRPLSEFIDRKATNVEFIANTAMQICSGLKAIHMIDILHRDLKPDNIFVQSDGHIKITDFGVARHKSSNLTRQHEVVGSVHYMAPEVWRGQKLTSAVDYYSLGVILYELATGQRPFLCDDTAQMMWLHVKRPAAPPRSLKSDIPPWLNQLILKLLEKKVDARLKDADEISKIIKANSGIQPLGFTHTASGRYRAVASAPVPSISTFNNEIVPSQINQVTKKERFSIIFNHKVLTVFFSAITVFGSATIIYRCYLFLKELLLL